MSAIAIGAMMRIYRRFWQVNWAEQWQYRANLLMYLLYWLVSPIVYLSVKWWKTLHQPFSSPETVDSPMVTPLRIAAFGMLFLAVFFMARRWRIAYAKLSREDEAPDLPPAAAAIQLEGGGS